MKVIKLLAALVLLLPLSGGVVFCASAHNLGSSPPRFDSTIMLQGFNWSSWKTSPWWNIVESKAGDMSQAGINLVWLPPSSDSASDEGYLPRRLYTQDSRYGSSAELTSAITALHAKGVKVIADIVVNHRVGTGNWADFTDPAWGPESVCSDDEWAQGKGAADTGKGVPFARDLDHTNAAVRKAITAWLAWLRASIGYDGWRYDFARGYGSKYMLMYNKATKPAFAVAEIWDDLDLNNTDPHRQALTDWMDSVGGEIKVFDFTTKGILQQAVASGEYWRLKDAGGRPSGLIGWWPDNAVTFVDNHDTTVEASSSKSWPFPSDKVIQGYAYILTHPGIPCVFWSHFFDWGLKNEITKLAGIRKTLGITSSSNVNIVHASQDIYAAVIDNKLAVKLGYQSWDPGSGWSLSVQGNGYKVWSKK
ncbi:MAG: alpha-amylase [Elusimicrobia bacterium GWC2_51_8]|nr:MAG: alpha-amylase [Elusimicrobia bacterium GWA2_51_34]OGR65510.1 MAG: alpha-amylase [Elusimicrobia bacterium GWC2_51_8]HCE97979.1 alpha-amylase [Elusimicrobiota bacterium]